MKDERRKKITKRTGLFPAGDVFRPVVTALIIQMTQVIVEDAELAAGGGLVAGEAIYERNDGIAHLGGVAGTAIGLVFDAVKAQQAEMFDSDAIHEQLLFFGLGVVGRTEVVAQLLIDGALIAGQSGKKNFIRGAHAVLESVAARTTPIPNPFPTAWRKGVRSRKG